MESGQAESRACPEVLAHKFLGGRGVNAWLLAHEGRDAPAYVRATLVGAYTGIEGVELGDGFDVVTQRGSEHRDEITPQGFRSNRAGGVLGGISSGQDILVSIALKPTSSIRLGGQTVDVGGQSTDVITKGRHDPCVGIRAVPIAEAMLATEDALVHAHFDVAAAFQAGVTDADLAPARNLVRGCGRGGSAGCRRTTGR